MARRTLPAAFQAAIDKAEREDTRPRARRMAIELRFPPSLNNLYPTIIGRDGRPLRVKSRLAHQYDDHVMAVVGLWVINNQQRPPAPPYRLTLVAWPPNDGDRHDLTNLFKAPEDAVMAASDGDDDDVLIAHAEKMPPGVDPRLELMLEHLDDAARPAAPEPKED